MNKDIVEGKWKQLKGTVRARWGKLTDDDVTEIGGNYQKLEGKIQERYGVSKDEADKMINEWK
jgi:uncharacterized protein YjbJ (UPF0337 family)